MPSAIVRCSGVLGGPVLGRRLIGLLVITAAVTGSAHGAAPLRPDPQSLEHAAPELIERLRVDPYDYFRFVNRAWIARVCDDFARELEGLPIVRLHGDAHVEQFGWRRRNGDWTTSMTLPEARLR